MNTSTQFAIEFEFEIGCTTLRLHGELDAMSTPVFATALSTIQERDVRFVNIDLSGLGFCNVGGLRAMTELAARLHAREGHVKLLDPWILTRLLDIVDLRSMFLLEEQSSCMNVSRVG